MIAILLLVLLLWLLSGKNEPPDPGESEQPPISEFGQLDNQQWGKPLHYMIPRVYRGEI